MSELLLDTHAWIWLNAGLEKKFRRPTLQTIKRCLRHGRCAVSVVSVWEVGMLAAKGRIRLSRSPMEWVAMALRVEGLRLEPLSVSAALESSQLPGEFHGDPADRMLVATARSLSATIVSADSAILSYAHHGFCSAIPC